MQASLAACASLCVLADVRKGGFIEITYVQISSLFLNARALDASLYGNDEKENSNVAIINE